MVASKNMRASWDTALCSLRVDYMALYTRRLSSSITYILYKKLQKVSKFQTHIDGIKFLSKTTDNKNNIWYRFLFSYVRIL
jgi:hypothetical protein